MRHRNIKKVLDRNRSSRLALLRSLANALIEREKIQTTKARAVALRSFLEPLVARAREKSVVTVRYLRTRLPKLQSVAKLCDVIGPRYAKRMGGYTRVIPIGRRKGDAAKMVIIEFV